MPAPATDRRVLIISPVKETLATLRTLLAEERCHLLEAADLDVAGRMLETQPVQVVVCECDQSGIDGVAFTRKLRQQVAPAGLAIILLVGESQDSRKLEGCSVGATGWLATPVQPDQARSLIRRLLD